MAKEEKKQKKKGAGKPQPPVPEALRRFREQRAFNQPKPGNFRPMTPQSMRRGDR